MEMVLVQEVPVSGVGTKEERSRVATAEGCADVFSLVLQSLMPLQNLIPLQSICAGGSSRTDDGGVYLSEGRLSTLEAASNQLPLKAAVEGLKTPADVPYQTLKAAVSGRREIIPQMTNLRGINESDAFSLEHWHPISRDVSVQRYMPYMPGQDVFKPLHSVNDIEQLKGFCGVEADAQGPNVVPGICLDDAKAAVRDVQQASGIFMDDGSSYHADAVTAGKEGIVFENGNVASRHQSSTHMRQSVGHESATPFASSAETVQEGLSDDVAALDDAQDGSTYDYSGRQERHIHDRLYAAGQPHRLFNEEMSSVSGGRAFNLHETLAMLADRVRVLMSTNRSEMEVRLNPQELGKIVVKVAMENGALSVRITVESQMVKDFLQVHAEELKAMLTDEGYNLAELDVSIGQGYQQPQRDDMGSGRWLESPVFKKSRIGMTAVQRSLTRVPGMYYDGAHRFDCFA
nr:MAG: hypothetical protein DIU64_09430 [Caldicoprobacter oshimai]